MQRPVLGRPQSIVSHKITRQHEHPPCEFSEEEYREEEAAAQGGEEQPQALSRIGRDIRLTKRMLQHATKLALAENNQKAQMEKWNLQQVEKAMQEKRALEASMVSETTPEDYIKQERGWWDNQLSAWSTKREQVRQEMEKQALEKLLTTQNAEQLQQLQDPKAAQQWLHLMEASLHPFISEINKSMSEQQTTSPTRAARVPAPNNGELQAQETKSGLWCTVPKTTEKFAAHRNQNLSRADWSTSFHEGEVGAEGHPADRYWDPSRPVSPRRAERMSRQPPTMPTHSTVDHPYGGSAEQHPHTTTRHPIARPRMWT